MTNLIKLLALFATALIVACGRTEEKSTNNILKENAPETEVYKDELAAQLTKARPDNLKYYFDHYAIKDGKEYLYVTIEGEVEGMAIVTVNQWDENLKGIHGSKGLGYSGAEFKNLKLDIVRYSTNISFIYKGMDGITD